MNKFSKQDTCILKGVAILLMIAHHLFFFPTRLPGNKIPISFTRIHHVATAVYIGRFGKMCVPIFLFLSGYGIYLTYQSGRLSIAGRIYQLYIKFWKVFVVFIPIGFLFFSNQSQYCQDAGIYDAFHTFRWGTLMRNILALDVSYNREWWFLKYYVVTILVFPLLYKIVSKRKVLENVGILLAFVLIFKYGISNLHTLPGLKILDRSYLYSNFIGGQDPIIASFWMGCILAKDHGMEKMIAAYQEWKLNTILVDSVGVLLIIIMRTTIVGVEFDCVVVPIICILLLDLVKRSSSVSFVFENLGRQSTNMWLIHSFFLYYFYQCVKIVLLPRYAILVLPWLIFLSFASGWLLDQEYRILGELYRWSMMMKWSKVERAVVKK